MRLLFIFICAPTTFLVVYDIVFYYIPILTNNYDSITFEYLFFMIIMDISALFISIYFLLVINHTKLNINNYPKSRYLSVYVYFIFVIIVVILIHYLIIHVFDTINYSQVYNNYGKFYAGSKRGTAWVFYLINMILTIMLYDIFLNGFTKLKFFSISTIIILVAMTGGRSNVMIIVLFMLFLHVVVHRKRISILTLLIGISMIPTFFVANSVMRSGTDVISYINAKKGKFDFDQAFILNDVIKSKNEGVDTYFIDLVDFKYMFIPRKVWKDKPMSTAATRLIYPDIANRGTSITFGLYANAFMNIGYFSLLIIPLFIFAFAYLYFKVIQTSHRNYIHFIIIFFAVNSVQLIRGGVFDSRVFRILVVFALAYFLFRIISKKYRF